MNREEMPEMSHPWHPESLICRFGFVGHCKVRKKEVNLFPVVAAELLTITVAAAATAMRHSLPLLSSGPETMSSSTLAHLTHPAISHRTESLKQVLLHLFFYHRQATD